MHKKSTEPQTSIKNNPNKKTLKTTQGSKPTEGFALTNTALNSYVYEYLKPLAEETYVLLEEPSRPPAKEPRKKNPEPPAQTKNMLTTLIASMVDTVDPQTIEIKEEERRSRRISNKLELSADINPELASILSTLIEPEETTEHTAPDYLTILKKIEKMNKNNRKRIVEKRNVYLSYLFYRSLLEKIDGSIETLFKKIKKKKKKEEDTNYYQELEELLEKRARFKSICRSIPDQTEEIEESTLGLESIEEVLSDKEVEAVRNMLPTSYIDTWQD